MTQLFEDMTVDELRDFADVNGIDLGRKRVKSSIREAIEEALSEQELQGLADEQAPVAAQADEATSPDGTVETKELPELVEDTPDDNEAFAYDETYYIDQYARDNGAPYGFNDTWEAFFGNVARRVKQQFNPSTVLDAGCALGVLVNEFNKHPGITAEGFDFSEWAINEGRKVTENIYLHDIRKPFPQRNFDIVTCIEVLEHLPEDDIEDAVANLCHAVADGGYLLFSSNPADADNASHETVRSEDYWRQQFKAHGFQVDPAQRVGYITKWALAFRKVK